MKIIEFTNTFDRFKLHRHADDIKIVYLFAADILLKDYEINKSGYKDKLPIENSIAYLQKVIYVDPFNDDAKELYAIAHILLTNFNSNVEENIILLKSILLFCPCSQNLHFILSHYYTITNDVESSILHLNYAINIIELKTKYPSQITHLENMLKMKGQYLLRLGELYHMMDDSHVARTYLLEALKSIPNDPDIHNHLAIIYTNIGNMDKAIYHYKQGIENVDKAFMSTNKKHLLAVLYANIGSVYTYEINYNTAMQYFDKSLMTDPTFLIAFTNKLFNLHYILHTIEDDMYLANLHKDVQRFFPQVIMNYKDSLPSYNPNQTILSWDGKNKQQLVGKTKLHIAFVSSEFMTSIVYPPVSYFIDCILKFINCDLFDITCYSMKHIDIQHIFPHIVWKVIPKQLKAQELKYIIEKDNVDILFDLAGHAGKNRLDTFALKPAPITVTYCGYPNTTGLANIDYRIVDKYCDSDGVSPGPGGVVRPSTQKYHSEKLLFMDRCFLSYTPFPDINKIPELQEQPALKNKYLTLGTFNRYNKITDKVVELWQKILYKCPNVRIILKAKEFNTDYIKQKFLDFWKDKTLLQRVNILPYADTYNEHMPDYNKIDIGLDTFPYSGTTTSCEALIMGVPILTLFDSDRQYHVQNVTSSLMINSELPEYVCLTEDEYLEKVEYYSNHLEELRGLKTTVRDKFMKNICDYPRFVSEFEDKMLHIYKTHEW
jgi:predicted O-linked N-acetylglucosamine transferase (SPINDLY family)